MRREASQAVTARAPRVCVVGSGPAGMVLALELARHGCRVTIVESGGEGDDERAQSLSEAEFGVEGTHAPMGDAVRRGWGGTSTLWGGRCVPYDPIDFEADSSVGLADAQAFGRPAWPLRYEQIAAHYARACAYADCGSGSFTAAAAHGGSAPPFTERFDDEAASGASGGEVRADHLERWCAEPALVERLGARIAAHASIERRLGCTCVGVGTSTDGREIVALRVVDTATGAPAVAIVADAYVLACGGVETTRLLLNFAAGTRAPRIDGLAWLGKGYMGHLSGKIANIRLEGDPKKTVFHFERVGGASRDDETAADAGGRGARRRRRATERYVRRRLTLADDLLRRAGLRNIAMWLDNPPPADPAHGSGILSIAYLAMRMPVIGSRLAAPAIRKSLLAAAPPGSLAAHLGNVLRHPVATLAFALRFVHGHYAAFPRLPGFFAYSPANFYALHYHAEQSPIDASRIELAGSVDALGLRRARISLRFDRSDAESVVAAHAALDARLRADGVGQLEFLQPPAERVEAVLAQARDGFHQIGSVRMATGPEAGVADAQGRIFGTSNLYACSSALFPTSGQANPTLTILAFAIHQAAHLAESVATPA